MDHAEVDNPPFRTPKGNTEGNDPLFAARQNPSRFAKMVALSKTLATLGNFAGHSLAPPRPDIPRPASENRSLTCLGIRPAISARGSMCWPIGVGHGR